MTEATVTRKRRDISRTITQVYFDRAASRYRAIDQVEKRHNVLRARDLTKDESHLFELASSIKEYSEARAAYDYGVSTSDSGITATAIADCTEGLDSIVWDIFILEHWTQELKKDATSIKPTED